MKPILVAMVGVVAMSCTQENFQKWPLEADFVGYIPTTSADTLVYITSGEPDTAQWDTLRFQVLVHRSFGNPPSQSGEIIATEVFNGSMHAIDGPPLAFQWDVFNVFDDGGRGESMGYSFIYLAGLEQQFPLPPIGADAPFNGWLAVGTDTIRQLFKQGFDPAFWMKEGDFPAAVELQGKVYLK
jgi:hypothetical protein